MKVSLGIFLAVFSALVGLLALNASTPNVLAEATKTVWVADLNNPGQVTVNSDGDIVIAEGGTGVNDGRILATRDLNADGDAMDAGEMTVIADGLPSISAGEPGEEGVFGTIAAVEDANGTYWVLNAMDAEPFPTGWVGSIVNGDFVPLADLGAYEAANDPDQDGVESNPWDLVIGTDGMIYVNDAAANATLKVDPDTGDITTYAVWPEFDNPLDFGPPTMDPVPTGIEVDPDGLLVTVFLTGFPFPQGGAYAAGMFDEDGDVLEEGETFAFMTGLTATTDLTHDENNVHYAVEVSTNLADEENPPPGRLMQYSPSGNVVVMDGLIGPISVAYHDGAFYVTELFAGIVSRIDNEPPAMIERSVLLLPGFNFVAYTGIATDVETSLGDLLDDISIIYSFDNASKEWSAFDPDAPAALNDLGLEVEQVVVLNVTADTPIVWNMEVE